MNNNTKPPLASLACVNAACDLYGQKGQDNLSVRKEYGRDNIRYLRCRRCGEEFSERKNTALWNSKIREAKAIAIGEHLAEGCHFKSTARLVKVDPSTVRRLNRKVGQHGQLYHEQEVQDAVTTELQADERHGFAGNKQQPAWEAEVIDPKSKLIIAHVQGARNEQLIGRLLADSAARVRDRHQVALFTDGLAAYRTLFPQIFGRPYQPPREGRRGPRPAVRYRIPRTAAHVQIIKHQIGHRLAHLEIHYAHGSQKRIDQALDRLGYTVPNTSAIERRNGTARLMSAAQTRKTLAFARKPDSKEMMGWWATTVYNWCRPHRSLKRPLPDSVGKKSMSNAPWLWPLVWPILSFPLLRFSSLLSIHPAVGDYFTALPNILSSHNSLTVRCGRVMLDTKAERLEMDRITWLKEMRHDCEVKYDRDAPLYGKKYGLYSNTTHQQFIQEFLSLLLQNSTILDAACGAGRYLPFLLEKKHSVIAIDQSQGMLVRAKAKYPGVQFEKIGLQEMTYREDFDGAICMDAMENVCPKDWPLVLSNFL